MKRILPVFLVILVLAGCAKQGQPLALSLSPEQIEAMNLETEVLAPWFLPSPANGYHKQGFQAGLRQGETDVATLEFCKADHRFPEPGQYLAQEYTLYCRLSDTWGVIVGSETLASEDLIAMVESLDVVTGPPGPQE